MKIAVIEDHIPLNSQYCDWLRKAVPEAELVQLFTREEAEAAIAKTKFSLVILDIILGPERNAGIGLIADLKRAHATPVLVVSSHPASIYKGILKELGAWDYLQKTMFEEDEFVDVVVEMVKATKTETMEDLQWGLETGVRWKGKKINIPFTASKFLAYIYKNRDRVVSYRELGDLTKSSRSKETVRQHVTHIATAFRDIGEPNPVKNEDMVGYFWYQPKA